MSAQPVALNPAARVLGRRFVAMVVDFLLFGAVLWPTFFLMAERVSAPPAGAVRFHVTLGDSTWAIVGAKGALWALIALALWLAYYAVLPGRTGFTPGKALTGLRVVRADGTLPAGVGRNAVRALAGFVDYFPYFLPGLVGWVIAISNPGRRRLGDFAGGTYVVTRQAAGHPLTGA